MKKLLLAPAMFLLLAGCTGSAIAKWDKAQASYNAMAEVAIKTAEDPNVSLSTRKTLAEIVARTAPVVEKGAEIMTRKQCEESPALPGCQGVPPLTSADKQYLSWALGIVSEASKQLVDVYATTGK